MRLFTPLLTSFIFIPRTVSFVPHKALLRPYPMVSFSTIRTTVPATSKKLTECFNEQVARELTASQLYLSASLWCNRKHLVGMESFLRTESDEERGHALKLIDFANKRKFPVQLMCINEPPTEWESVEALWKYLLQAEQENTEALKILADLADQERDHSLSALLDPLHMEQVESEDMLRTTLAKIRDEQQTPGLLRTLDMEFSNTNNVNQ